MVIKDGVSEPLMAAIKLRLERGEQSLIFLNRRGYAPVLSCTACGWISRCTRCAANLVLHLADRRLRCHHCGFEGHVPRACPSCGNQDILPFRPRHAAA
jgi:primosomal protein N' (replication factor Y)